MSSSSLQFESLLGRCRSSVFGGLPRALRAADVRGRLDSGNHWRHLRAVWVAAPLSLTSMRHVKQHGNVRCPAILPYLPQNTDSMQFVRPATQGASVVRWCACAPRRGPLHTRQWVGTYAGKGNGEYRGELASALRAITAYLRHFALSSQVALVRLDGQ